MIWANRARGLVGRGGGGGGGGGSLASLIIPGWRGSASANAYCNRYLGSAISLKNPVREAMPLRQLVSPPHLQSRLFSSANELGVQHQEGAPVHQERHNSSYTNWHFLGKMPFIDAFLFKMKNNPKLLMNKKIWSRRSMILPEFVNSNVRIYNGKSFIRRKITESMVGHKFGEFAFTRKRMKLKTSTVKKKAKKA